MGHEFNSKKPNMGDLLCDELLEEILSRLPDITSLINCKHVSKSWSRSVSNLCCRRGANVGFIGIYCNLNAIRKVSSKLQLFHPPLMKQEDDDDDNVDVIQARRGRRANKRPRVVHKREIDCIMEITKCLDLYRLTNLLDSCNGLILCRGLDDIGGVHYYVGIPILDQWTLLPPPPKQDDYATGFVFDGIQGHHYKILHLCMRETTRLTNRSIQCQVFSSETGQWREHHATILNSWATLGHCIKLIRGSSIHKKGLYRSGALHWTFAHDHKYMLVFYVETEAFRFIELPGDHGSIVYRMDKCLWESEGFLHYAVGGGNYTFHVWKNTNDHGNDINKQHRWVHLRLVTYISMLRENPKEKPKVLICRYEGCSLSKSSIARVPKEYINNGSGVVNLGTILKYFCNNGVLDSAKTLRVSWKYVTRKNGGGITRNHLTGAQYPYVFNLVDLPIWDGCTLLKHPN